MSQPGTAQVIRADSRHLPLDDNTVDLVVTSPPYFALRSYQDGGEHYAGQIGDEPTPAEFVDALLEVTAECVRVLKPSGSLFVNLGDSYSSGGRGTRAPDSSARRRGFRETNRPQDGARPKSLMGIPWRYALRCIDDLGLILRAEIIWSKPNGLPESVTDRVRRSHETWFHFTLNPRYYSAVDHIREETNPANDAHAARYREAARTYGRAATDSHPRSDGNGNGLFTPNPLGKLPGSVWTIPEGESLTRSVLSAVAAGGITIEEGERILWGQRESRSWPTSTGPASAGSGEDGETHAATARLRTSSPDARTGRTESAIDFSSDPSPKGSPSTISAGTSDASDPTISSRSRVGRTSAEPTLSAPRVDTDTHSLTPTSTSRQQASPTSGAGPASSLASDVTESVWVVPTEPLQVPEHLGVDHFAAFPSEFPRRIIQGWSPAGVCTACGEGRRPVVVKSAGSSRRHTQSTASVSNGTIDIRGGDRALTEHSMDVTAIITGEACACTPYHIEDADENGRGVTVYDWHLWEPAPTTPGIVLDPFGGTGTTALVAKALGRHGITVDMSADYCRLAEWRTNDPKQLAKAARRPFTASDAPMDGQVDLLSLLDGEGA